MQTISVDIAGPCNFRSFIFVGSFARVLLFFSFCLNTQFNPQFLSASRISEKDFDTLIVFCYSNYYS